jgi:hypothetical protein
MPHHGPIFRYGPPATKSLVYPLIDTDDNLYQKVGAGFRVMENFSGLIAYPDENIIGEKKDCP